MNAANRSSILRSMFLGTKEFWPFARPSKSASIESSSEKPPSAGVLNFVAASPNERASSRQDPTWNHFPCVITTSTPALPPELLKRTETLPLAEATWWERVFQRLRLPALARRSRDCRRAWTLFRKAPHFEAVITDGAACGFLFACLQFVRGRRRPVHVMYDCYWYGGSWIKRLVMQFCLRQVDLCVVWSRVECVRYAKAYRVSPSKFALVRHHHTLKRYQFEVGDDGYIFAGGNSDRDYGLLLDALRDLPIPCVLATNLQNLLQGLRIPSSVRVVNASASEFRQLMARARVVVVPMKADLLRTGGQQTFLNAMYMAKPTVLTDPEGGVDYIENTRTGLLVPYGDPAALRHAIQWLWSNPAEARSIGLRAREASVPLTTERCNIEIWNHAFELAHKARNTGN